MLLFRAFSKRALDVKLPVQEIKVAVFVSVFCTCSEESFNLLLHLPCPLVVKQAS